MGIKKTYVMTGGRRRGAGRKKGSRNRTTIELERVMGATGVTKPEAMLLIMRDESQPSDLRQAMAKAALPYFYSRMPTITVPYSSPLAHLESQAIVSSRDSGFQRRINGRPKEQDQS